MNITQIVESIGESLPIESVNDLPMIRQALNDAVDAAVKDGEMTEAKANDCGSGLGGCQRPRRCPQANNVTLTLFPPHRPAQPWGNPKNAPHVRPVAEESKEIMSIHEMAVRWKLMPISERMDAYHPRESNELRRIVHQIEDAAPDLFLACEKAAAALRGLKNQCDEREWREDWQDLPEALEVLEAALKKAKGQS